jgi:hypothetical protein
MKKLRIKGDCCGVGYQMHEPFASNSALFFVVQEVVAAVFVATPDSFQQSRFDDRFRAAVAIPRSTRISVLKIELG